MSVKWGEEMLDMVEKWNRWGRARRWALRVLIAMTLVALGLLAVPMLLRWHARSVRAELAAANPDLAWLENAPLPSGTENWVAARLAEAMAPLQADLGRRARVGDRAAPAVPPAPGVRDLKEWLQRELADPMTEIRPLPDAAVRHLEQRAPELERVRTLLLAGDGIRWSWNAALNHPLKHVESLLLADALESARVGRHEEARRGVLAAWRLARSCLHASIPYGREMIESVVVAMRRLPDISSEWIERLDAGPIRSVHADVFVLEADRLLRFVENYPRSIEESCVTSSFMQVRTVDARIAWWVVGDARTSMAVAAELEDPSRCGQPLTAGAPRVQGTPTARTMDRLIVQLELTRKLAQVHEARRLSPNGAWPEHLDGIEESTCHGLAWHYRGGAELRLEPQGPALAWLIDRPGKPAVAVVTR